MYIVSVTLHVKPEAVAAFIAATILNCRGSRTEPGNLRFDLHQAEDEPTRFLLHEIYRTKEDFARHQQTPHYASWKAAVGDWMAQPRVAEKYRSLYPEDADW